AVADDDGSLVAVSTWIPSVEGTWQVRGMAVDPAVQGRGVGRLLLDGGVARARGAGVSRLWAHGRDSALGFYQRLGWSVVGDGYVTAIGLPHHLIELEL